MALERAVTSALATHVFAKGTPGAVALLRSAWAHAVGPELARRTEVVGVEGSTLRVRVPEASWRKVLHRMRGDILSRLRQTAGPLAPFRLGFVEGPLVLPEVAGPSLAPRAPSVEAPTTTSEALASAAQAIADPEIRSLFLESAARYLTRAENRRPSME